MNLMERNGFCAIGRCGSRVVLRSILERMYNSFVNFSAVSSTIEALELR